jgi:hypothetical protein
MEITSNSQYTVSRSCIKYLCRTIAGHGRQSTAIWAKSDGNNPTLMSALQEIGCSIRLLIEQCNLVVTVTHSNEMSVQTEINTQQQTPPSGDSFNLVGFDECGNLGASERINDVRLAIIRDRNELAHLFFSSQYSIQATESHTLLLLSLLLCCCCLVPAPQRYSACVVGSDQPGYCTVLLLCLLPTPPLLHLPTSSQ